MNWYKKAQFDDDMPEFTGGLLEQLGREVAGGASGLYERLTGGTGEEIQKARKDWEAACTGLRVLENYTKPKFVKARQSDIAISIARVEAVEQIYRIAM